MDNQNRQDHETRYRRRGSLFWPLLLIVAGILLLLSNSGAIGGSFWDYVGRYWPLLLIVMGLDGIYRREGLVGNTFVIGLGIVFQLANLGFLALDVWQVVIRLWPLLLIAIGFDVIIGRRSMIASLVGLIVILALLFGALVLMGVRVGGIETMAGESVQQSLEGITQARIQISPGAGSLKVDAMDEPSGLIGGTVPAGRGHRIQGDYSESNGVGEYILRETGANIVFGVGTRGDPWNWDINLTTEIPLDLDFEMGAGSIDADLSDLQIDTLNTSMGVGQTIVTLPENDDFAGTLSGAIGQLVIIAPRDSGLRIDSGTALGTTDLPDGFTEIDGLYTSPNFESADYKFDLNVSMAIGMVEVRYR
jgi:hypothetical protein